MYFSSKWAQKDFNKGFKNTFDFFDSGYILGLDEQGYNLINFCLFKICLSSWTQNFKTAYNLYK